MNWKPETDVLQGSLDRETAASVEVIELLSGLQERLTSTSKTNLLECPSIVSLSLVGNQSNEVTCPLSEELY